MSDRATYVITGGCGFIGSHIADALVEQGHRVRVLDNLSSGYERNIAHLGDRVEFVKGDVRELDTVRRVVAGADYVFHEAALVSVFDSVNNPLESNDINISGTLNVLEACRQAGVKRFVMASSAANYGNDPELPKRESMKPRPESPYAIGKIVGEYYCRVYHTLYHLETVALRYFNVYGPRQDPASMYSGVISRFVDVLGRGERPTVFGDGRQTRDFVFVKDVVQANLLAMHSPDAGHAEVFNIGTGRQSSLLELLEVLNELTGQNRQPVFEAERAGDIKYSVSDITRAGKVLNYKPAYSLRDGLAALLKSVQG